MITAVFKKDLLDTKENILVMSHPLEGSSKMISKMEQIKKCPVKCNSMGYYLVEIRQSTKEDLSIVK